MVCLSESMINVDEELLGFPNTYSALNRVCHSFWLKESHICTRNDPLINKRCLYFISKIANT